MAGDGASPKALKVCFGVKPPAGQTIRPWEFFFVVGNSQKLGGWDPNGALELTRRSPVDSSEWIGSMSGTADEFDEPLRFRYFTGYYLESSKKIRVISRWESWVSPRSVIPTIEASSSGVCRENVIDEFGYNGGRRQLSEGWLQDAEHNEILLRVHGEALKFYKSRHAQRTYRIRLMPFDLRHRESTVDDEDSQSSPSLPPLPSFSHTDIAILSNLDPSFRDQQHYGDVFQNNRSYFVYRTQTVAVEYLAFRIEFFVERSSDSTSDESKDCQRLPERVAIAYCLPSSMQHSFGKIAVPVLGRQQQPIGQISIDYLLVKALSRLEKPLKMDVSYCHHWKKRTTLEVGHRGSGNSYTKFAATRENTIHSLNNAARNGADFVEFDVQLTKDRTAVIFHDFHVLVSVAKRASSLLLEPGKSHVPPVVDLHQMAIKDLKMNQLHLLHLDHYQHDTVENSRKGSVKVSEEEYEGEDHRPFPTLVEALQNVLPETGFNIEVKYPMMMKNGCHECENYFERNEYIDVILHDVLTYAEGRRIVFSSFDPDICSIISLKQNRYPVLFLCVGATTRYVPFLDERSSTSMTAVNFAAGIQLLGVNFHSEELLRDIAPLERASAFGLVSFVWGDDLDNQKNIEYFKELFVDGLIYDRIGELKKRQNVFTVEREAKNALFKTRTPIMSTTTSRSTSVDGGAMELPRKNSANT
uniref:Glycerophosphocholine phosphodiesterase GPCPD1 n=1 Tax=Steinernema glaseri TaxID=37863 RepID=A0A1I7YHD8_9BILA